MKNNIYVVSYPDYLDKKVTLVIHNLPADIKQVLLPLLFDKLPEDSAIAIGSNIEWAKRFKNAYWFTTADLGQEKQYVIDSVNTLLKSCDNLFQAINNIT